MSYGWVVFVHVAAATLLLGTSIVGEPVVRAAARRTTRASDLRACLEVGRRMSGISPVAAMLVLASGVYLTHVGWAWTVGWILVSLVLWLVNSVVAIAVVKRAIERVKVEAILAPEESVGTRLDELRWSDAWTWGGDLLAVNDAVMLWIMVMKPTLAASAGTVLLAYGAVVIGRFAVGLRRPARPSPQASGAGA